MKQKKKSFFSRGENYARLQFLTAEKKKMYKLNSEDLTRCTLSFSCTGVYIWCIQIC